MAGIPPVFDADAEDVAWALQTAEALWKRNERLDAIVWLRRAAQAAGEAEDDDRALALARDAAELSEWLARNPVEAQAAGALAPRPSAIPPGGEAVDDLLRTSQVDEQELRGSEIPLEIEEEPIVIDVSGSTAPPAVALPPPTPVAEPSPPPMPDEVVEEELDDADITAADDAHAGPEKAEEGRISHVPSAAEKHAGILDPWAEAEPAVAKEEPRKSVGGLLPAPIVSRAADQFEPEEVVTSAPPMDRPATAVRILTPRPPSKPPTKPSTPPTVGVDLSNIEAFSDLPEDAKTAFANKATMQKLKREEEVSGFALALVLEGQVDLAATIVDAPAVRLGPGRVLCARGTIDHATPVRLIGASDASCVATWDGASVEPIFESCPWIADDLRAAADRFQAEVGITLGPLGERLDMGLRSEMTRRLSLRVLSEGEVCAARGKPMPGLLVVGAGELELVDEHAAMALRRLRAGDFVFPSEVLRAALAPQSVRAAKGGALVLFAERGIAQELLVTCPPLLEIFADG